MANETMFEHKMYRGVTLQPTQDKETFYILTSRLHVNVCVCVNSVMNRYRLFRTEFKINYHNISDERL